ncbi:hypothetical protein OG946_03805 [Streptomyces sp. NBC_01808]|uniref:hypothetical protein n=1 Tax=Streptomyces sp. NBC_01808 TaxID=2975947 RepID=UPI002DD9B1DB|nr:hypothetical protein [Streptomyces sp. NBC_01808]WSA36582.1 hypothetical protein OG946_03805 [Streptomyces sp. NBC_01808]
MRRLATALAAVLAGAAALTPLAQAAAPAASPPDPAPGGPQRPYEPDVEGTDNIDTLDVTATRGPGRSVTVAFDRRSRAAEGTTPAGARRFVFLFDRSVSFRPDSFPTCARAVVEADGVAACPPGSLVGEGLGTWPDGSEHDVSVVNTRVDGTPGVLVVIPGVGSILEQTFERIRDPYYGDYGWAADEILPPSPVPPGERAGTTRFQLSFGATREDGGRTVGFVETTARPGDKLRFGLWSEFVTGQVVLPTATVRLGP